MGTTGAGDAVDVARAVTRRLTSSSDDEVEVEAFVLHHPIDGRMSRVTGNEASPLFHGLRSAVNDAAAAARITSACRPNDEVARVGGDEFAVLLHDVDADSAPGPRQPGRRVRSAGDTQAD